LHRWIACGGVGSTPSQALGANQEKSPERNPPSFSGQEGCERGSRALVMQTQTDHSEPVLYGASLQRSERNSDRTLGPNAISHWEAEGASQWPYGAP